jgi:UDP-N-acetylmuramate: L-alanyl-gamma-D-glutamyl-meso-diaminopimelate ligase
MKVHFIAIGGSAMHNLAIALHKKGFLVTGSDDEICEPSKSRLARFNLLPAKEGWDEANIHEGLDAVILGMHAKMDNPELKKAEQLGIKVFSYPEYLYEQSKNKTRIVIGGSHGKTTITAMILHVVNDCGLNCDYMVGAQLEGFDVMVKLSEDARFMILEGDEYLTSPIDRRPKFHLYRPHIALLSGIAWDHINVFPTIGNYIEQFTQFIRLIVPGGTLIWCAEDETLQKICRKKCQDIILIPYSSPDYQVEDGITMIRFKDQYLPIQVFGKHNLLNLNGSRLVCNAMGITDEQFYSSIQSFKGASRRLERIAENKETTVFRDFAHSPSKLVATLNAVKEQYPEKKLVACMELHTFSSLSQEFLSHYKGCMDAADRAIVYFNPHAIQLKKLPPITANEVKKGFANKKLEVFTDSHLLKNSLLHENWHKKNLLMMSSGNFDGLELNKLAETIVTPDALRIH